MDGEYRDYFGLTVGVSGEHTVIGVPDDDNANGNQAGAAFIFDLNCPTCLDLTVKNLVAGKRARFGVSGGTAGAVGVIVFGFEPGRTKFENFARYCATFGIDGVDESRLIDGSVRRFDANGEIAFERRVPIHLAGLRFFFQSAQRGTCPDECVSNLVELTVQ